MTQQIILTHPSGARGLRIHPVFLPFAGCPFRCVFCAQDRQTGHRPEPVATSLERMERQLAQRDSHTEVELAFYGGTFTSLPLSQQAACMEAAARLRARGMVNTVRCSTRPDAVSPEGLQALKDAGMDLVELGVQSFQDTPLLASGRGYTGETATRGCHWVREAGLQLGIQLLPGMPSSTPATFLQDVAQALKLEPSCMRFYPCLVLEGTELASLWRSGCYTPWTLDDTISTLSSALKMAWECGIPVIRLSLAPEQGMEESVLAGPRHPALGNMIQAEALLLRVVPLLTACPSPVRLTLPRWCQGLYAGHQKQLLPRWKALGVAEVLWSEGNVAEVCTSESSGRARHHRELNRNRPS